MLIKFLLDYFKEINGRIFPIDDNVPRLVPADQIEVHRLDIQHTALRLLLNGNYYGPVKDVLADSAGRRKRVLDLLTAEGNWVREMAVEFPHVDFTSVDTIPLVPHVRQANILNFEVYDLYNGIAEPDESFDVVHLRHPISRIRDLQALIGEIHRVLRPGGLFLHSEFQNHPFDASTHDHSAAYTLPNLTRAMQIVESACIQQGAHVHAWKEVPFMLEPNHELWRENIKEHQRGFRSIRKDALILPTGPWHPTPRLHNVGVLIQWASTQMWSNLRPMFIGHGMSESETDELERGIREELAEPGSKKLYVNYHVLYAFKPV
ncbi:S-adenosyl-L-methionine-dependent methyltransferase [Ceratobasidium sp. AG-I]|nr:S-adenosyl-L-methionine-dependent methyltransferase [Ceratobasidium sp. AG-I]